MDTWKCDECNMKFDSRLLYDTHKRKFCGMLGGPPAPGSSRIPQRGYGKTMVHTGRRGKSISPKELVLSLGEKSPQNFHYHPTRISTAGSSVHDVSQRMSALEQEKVEELKAFKASMSLQRAYQHSKINSGPGRKVPDSRQSRSSPNYQLDRTLFDDQLKQLEDNHQEQLDQLRAHNERLKEEKLAIQEKMNSLGLKSRHKLVSQGSVDKQEAEFEGLRKYLDYKSQEMRNEYQAEMDKLKDLKKKIHGRYSLSPETPLSTKRSSPAEQPRDTLKLYNTGAQNHNPLNVQPASPIPLPQYAALQGSGLLGEINAMEISYLQGGGRDPEVLSQIKQLELEAKSLQPVSTAVPDPSLQQQIMAYHLANQKLEQELQLLRMERQQNDGLRKTPELSSEFQRLKAEHLEKMAGLKQESEMLKQLTEIERMKKELNEIKGNKVVVTDDEDKQKYETPFLMSTSGMEKSLLPSPYDPSAGFSVFLDFVLGMPSSSIKCRLAVGIYNVTELVSDVKVLPLVNVVNKHNSKIPSGGVAVFGIMYPFPKCAPIQTLSVIAELQANSTDDPQDPHKLFSKGWTKMDLFDTADRLISGRWKIPFRVPPIKTYLSYNELNRIPQVGIAELYIRLVNARDVKQEEILSPQPLQYYMYKYPTLDNPVVHHYSRQRIAGKTPSTRESIDEPPLPPPTAPYRRDTRGAISLTSLKSEHNHSDSSSITGFQVDQLYKAIDGEAKIKITAYSQQDGEILKAAGDTPVMCVTKSCKQDFLKDIYVFGLQEVRFRQVQWNSKSIVVVRVYLQPKDPGTDQIPAVNLLDESRLASWTLIPLGYSNGRLSRQSAQGVGSSSSLNVGTHTVPIFFPPVPEITDMPVKIDKYPSEWSRYGRAALTMAIFSGFQRPLESPSPPPEYVEENEVPKNAWLKNARSSVTNQMFTPGSGFDLYIDGARFLPDSVTVSKVAGRVMDKNYDKVGPDVEAQSKLYSDIYNPEFDHRLEFREPVFPATSTLMLKVYTVDRLSKKLCCLGYAVLPIFLKLGSTDPPSNNSDTEKFSLNEGAHQIRIFNGAPDFSQPLGPSLIQKLKPVPCASLLVRIVLAACHPNGRPKETSEFPESQWEREGLVVAKQRYEEGQYFSLSCEPTLGECQIFHSMVLRQPLTVRESVKLIGNNQENNMKKDRVIASWIKTQLTRSIDAAPEDFNLNYVALYHQLHGLKVSVDGAQNLPWSSFTFATYCLSPPGSFYKGDQSDPLTYSSQLVYSSDVSSPVWLDGMKTFPRRLYHQFLVLVVHLHEVTVDFSKHQEVYGLKGQPSNMACRHVMVQTSIHHFQYNVSLVQHEAFNRGCKAWTVIQVFNEGYVLNGSYQLPLYQGEPSESILDALQNDYCHDVMAAFRRNQKIKFLEGASVFLRLSDSRREEELPKPMSQVIQDYIPKERLDRYTVLNPSNPLSSILPAGVDEDEFCYSLPDKFKEMMKHIFGKTVSEPSQNQT